MWWSVPSACRYNSRLPGEAHDNRLAGKLLFRLKSGTMLLADRGYDALAAERGAWAKIPPRCDRSEPICFSPYLYSARILVERFFNKFKQCRRVATRYDKLAANSSSLHRYGCGCALMSPRPTSLGKPLRRALVIGGSMSGLPPARMLDRRAEGP
jgi:transposase